MEIIQQANATRGYFHGFRYSSGYYYGSTRESPSRLVRIEEADITKQDVIALSANSGEDLEIVGNRIFVVTSGGVNVVTKSTFVKEGTVIPAPSGTGYAGRVIHKGDYLYASYLYSSKLQKIQLSDLSVANTESYSGDALLHAMICDANYIYGANSDTVIKINSDTLEEVARTIISGFGFITDDMAEHGDYLYLGGESYSDKTICKLKKDFSSYAFKSLNDKSYGVLTDGNYIYCLGFVNNKVYKLDFDLNLVASLDIDGKPNEIAFGSGTKALVTTWTSPAKLVLVNIPRPPPCGNYGDVNDDGYVTDADSQMIADHIAGGGITLTPEQLIRADVNNDGKVTGGDAMIVWRYANGVVDTFPVCEKKTITFKTLKPDGSELTTVKVYIDGTLKGET